MQVSFFLPFPHFLLPGSSPTTLGGLNTYCQGLWSSTWNFSFYFLNCNDNWKLLRAYVANQPSHCILQVEDKQSHLSWMHKGLTSVCIEEILAIWVCTQRPVGWPGQTSTEWVSYLCERTLLWNLSTWNPSVLDSAAVNAQEGKDLLLGQMLSVPCPYLAGSHCSGPCPGVQLQALLSLCLTDFSWQARCAEIILGAAVHQWQMGVEDKYPSCLTRWASSEVSMAMSSTPVYHSMVCWPFLLYIMYPHCSPVIN